jgi:hypothetical protein
MFRASTTVACFFLSSATRRSRAAHAVRDPSDKLPHPAEEAESKTKKNKLGEGLVRGRSSVVTSRYSSPAVRAEIAARESPRGQSARTHFRISTRDDVDEINTPRAMPRLRRRRRLVRTAPAYAHDIIDGTDLGDVDDEAIDEDVEDEEVLLPRKNSMDRYRKAGSRHTHSQARSSGLHVN